MKTLSIIRCAAALFLAAGCATVPEQKDDASAPISGSTVVLTVYGMSCPLCSNNLDGQFEKIAGVERVHIDLDTGAVTLDLAEGHAVSREQLAAAVKAAGFTLAEVQTPGT